MTDRIETQSELWWAKGYAKGMEENAKSLAESRAQVAALTAERDAAEAELAAAKQDKERLADRIVREVAEIPDRFSPEDDSRMMLVRDDELRTIIIARHARRPRSRGHDCNGFRRRYSAVRGLPASGLPDRQDKVRRMLGSRSRAGTEGREP